MNTMNFEQVDPKTWRAGYLTFKDLGKIAGGVTHRYDVCSAGDSVLGQIVWYAGWRRYTFKPSLTVETWYDSACLTTIAEFCMIRTDERKAHWGPQGRFADR